MTIRDFIREHADSTIEVHANIDSYDYLNASDVYATVTADMTDDEIEDVCEKVCNDYYNDMKEEWFCNPREKFVSHMAPRVWLQADDDEYTVYDEEEVEAERTLRDIISNDEDAADKIYFYKTDAGLGMAAARDGEILIADENTFSDLIELYIEDYFNPTEAEALELLESSTWDFTSAGWEAWDADYNTDYILRFVDPDDLKGVEDILTADGTEILAVTTC